MTRRLSIVFATAVLTAATVVPATAADAAAKPPRFANCTAVHQHYKGGIARSGARDHRPGGGHARYRPYVNTAYYNANKQMDRDRDGIACEQ